MVSFDIGGRRDSERALLRPIAEEPQGRAAVLAQLALHFACFFSNVSTLVVYGVFGEWKFFGTLLAAWLLCGVFVSWAALKEFHPRANARCWVLRWLWVVLVFGLLRGLQVRHICRFFRQRQAVSANGSVIGDGERSGRIEPTAFNSKTFDGIIEGLFFAVGNQFAFFMVDIAPPDCPWYMTSRFAGVCPTCPRLRFIFLFSALCSMLTLAAAIVEVDYRVSTSIRGKIDAGSWRSFIHFAYRASEVVLRLSAINLVCIFLRPQPRMQTLGGPYLLYMPLAVIWFVDACILYNSTKTQAADQESPVAHAVVALAAIAVNPTQFVDRPIYRGAAKSTAKAFFCMHLLELAAMGAFVGWCWNSQFPAACDLEGHPEPGRPSKIGLYTLWSRSNHRVAYAELGAAMVVHFGIIVSQPYTRRVLNLCAARAEPEQHLQRVDTRSFHVTSVANSLQGRLTVPRGFSSYLVQVGTGVTSKFFANREYAMTDFSIEKVLGRGSWGVVVKVQALWRGGEPLPPEQRRYYAVKLAHVRTRLQATYALREQEYLVKLQEHRHPFIMRLEHFFDVPPQKEGSEGYTDENDEVIEDLGGNCCFHKALMMEYCPRGDLDGYLRRHALEAPGLGEPPPPTAEDLRVSLQWLDQARRLCAQLLEAVRFLHGENFIHRDLKPGNVLLKKGPEGLHVCITDFGFAKQPLEGDLLHSVAGDLEYMAPEIQRIYLSRQWVGDPYTPAVDLWSLGKMILIMLWDAKYLSQSRLLPEGVWMLQMPRREWVLGADAPGGEGAGGAPGDAHPRVPACALRLVEQMMSDDAAGRGTAAELVQDPFFEAVSHRGAALPALDFSNCRQRAAGGWY